MSSICNLLPKHQYIIQIKWNIHWEPATRPKLSQLKSLKWVNAVILHNLEKLYYTFPFSFRSFFLALFFFTFPKKRDFYLKIYIHFDYMICERIINMHSQIHAYVCVFSGIKLCSCLVLLMICYGSWARNSFLRCRLLYLRRNKIRETKKEKRKRTESRNKETEEWFAQFIYVIQGMDGWMDERTETNGCWHRMCKCMMYFYWGERV